MATACGRCSTCPARAASGLVAYARVADLDAGAVGGAWVQREAGSEGGGEQVIAGMVESPSQEEVGGWVAQYRRRLVVNARNVVEDQQCLICSIYHRQKYLIHKSHFDL